ncbi:unnamed protein product [Callosobruchus maculatus]|uniref:Secreted protein n=1 Tax=Callosobruchus maculatus TaxID=64391 RepID=A0A653DII4_CALMS|nr:unnamed protein product [Callosobruchus maculatus]
MMITILILLPPNTWADTTHYSLTHFTFTSYSDRLEKHRLLIYTRLYTLLNRLPCIYNSATSLLLCNNKVAGRVSRLVAASWGRPSRRRDDVIDICTRCGRKGLRRTIKEDQRLRPERQQTSSCDLLGENQRHGKGHQCLLRGRRKCS